MPEERDFLANHKLQHVRRYEEMLSNNASFYFDVDQFEEIIDYYLLHNKTSKALKAVLHAADQHPSATSLFLKKAQVLNDKGEPGEALGILNKIEGIESSNPEVYYTKGVALYISGNTEQAIEQFHVAIRLSDDSGGEIISNIALFFEQQGKPSMALKYFRMACRYDPDNVSLIYDLAYCYEKLDDFSNSAYYYERCLDADPFSAGVWYNLGVVYSHAGESEKAIQAFDYSIALEDDFVSAYLNKAGILADQERYSEAVAVYHELSGLEPNNEEFAACIGECYEKMEEWDKSRYYYSKALDINPDYAGAWIGLGMILAGQQRVPESLYYVKKAVELEPDNSDFWKIMGNIYFRLEFTGRALEAFSSSVKLNPSDHESWINIAEIYLRRKQTANASEILNKVALSEPPGAGVNYRLSACFMVSGDKENAKKFLERALKTDFGMRNEYISYFPGGAKNEIVAGMVEKYSGNRKQ